MKNSEKITLTYKQLKKLVKESLDDSEFVDDSFAEKGFIKHNLNFLKDGINDVVMDFANEHGDVQIETTEDGKVIHSSEGDYYITVNFVKVKKY